MKPRRNRARLGKVSVGAKTFHVSADSETIFIRPRYGRVEFSIPIINLVGSAIHEAPADSRPAQAQNL